MKFIIMYFFLFPFILLLFPSQVQIFPLHPVLKQPQSKSHSQWTVQTDTIWTSLFSSAFASLELMKIKKEQILFHFLFILPNQTQWTHQWYHLYLHHHQLQHNELKMVAPNVQNPAEVAWNSLSQTITIPKQQQWIYYIWGNITLKSQQNIVVEWQSSNPSNHN